MSVHRDKAAPRNDRMPQRARQNDRSPVCDTVGFPASHDFAFNYLALAKAPGSRSSSIVGGSPRRSSLIGWLAEHAAAAVAQAGLLPMHAGDDPRPVGNFR